MAWKVIPGLNGKVYVPDSLPESPRKHCCADCFSCQLCSDERCSLCLGCKGKEEKIRTRIPNRLNGQTG